MSRAATAADAVQGLTPRTVYAPASLQEAGEVLASLSRAQQACVFVGGGTQLGLGAPPRRLDAVVRTERLARIVEYAPSDQVVTVEAGVTLGTLQAALAKERQRLSLDAPWPERATLGGILATNSFGPLRARYGAVRDLILGVTLVRSDGVLAKGGGKVVKNVAGFDLPKLACGSLGTLGLIAQATLRVHPLPERSEARLARGLGAEAVPGLVDAVRAAQLEPAALLATRAAPGRWDVALRFEGFAAGLAQQLARLGELTAVEPCTDAPFEAHRAAREGAGLRLKLAALPTQLPQVEAALAGLLPLLPGAQLAWYPTLGLGFLSAPAPAASVAAALAAARSAMQALRGTLTLETAPDAVRGQLEAWSAPPSLALQQAVKARFDPEGLLAPGRFVGGI